MVRATVMIMAWKQICHALDPGIHIGNVSSRRIFTGNCPYTYARHPPINESIQLAGYIIHI